MNMTMILKNGTALPLSQLILPLHLVMKCANFGSLQTIYNEMSEENLSEIVVTQNGVEMHRASGAKIQSFQAVHNPDGTLTVHFFLSGTSAASSADASYVQAAKILLGEEE